MLSLPPLPPSAPPLPVGLLTGDVQLNTTSPCLPPLPPLAPPLQVGLLTGDVQLNTTSPCLIMTTEILRSMLYKVGEGGGLQDYTFPHLLS